MLPAVYEEEQVSCLLVVFAVIKLIDVLHKSLLYRLYLIKIEERLRMGFLQFVELCRHRL